MKNADRLLKKKGWTGKEVGKLLFQSMLSNIRGQDDPTYKPAFTQKDFNNMVTSLSTDRDYLEYDVYSTIYHSIIDDFNRGQGFCQQFYNGFHRLFESLTECFNADLALKDIDRIPLIMTESQYNRLEVEARSELKSFKESFCSLVFHCLDYFLDHEEVAPDDLKKALEACKKKSSKGNKFLPLYNEIFRGGYYQLPDGTRSDKVTQEEWEEAIKRNYLKTHELIVDGVTSDYGETLKHFNRSRLLTLYRLLFQGVDAVKDLYKKNIGKELNLTPEEEVDLMEALESLSKGDGRTKDNPIVSKLLPLLDYDNTGEWHTYTEVPDDLSLYDLLGLYIETSTGGYEDIDEKTARKLLKKDAPELYKAITSYIESKVTKAKGLKPNQLYKPLISWGELAKLHFTNFEALIEPEDFNIIETFLGQEDSTRSKSYRMRGACNGIAIIKNPNSSQVDANGDYIEEKPLSHFQNLYTLEEDLKKITEIKRYAKTLIYPAISFLYSYNAFLGIISREYDIPDLQEVASFDTRLFESKASRYNDLIYFFYHEVYGNTEEMERKRAIIKDIFNELELEKLKPTEEAIQAVEEKIKGIGITSKAKTAFRTLDTFIDRLSNGKGVQ